MAARMTDWMDTVITLNPTNGGSDNVSLITGAAPINMRGATLIRTLVRLDFSSATVAGAWGIHECQFAIGIASQEAFAAGVLPDPRTATDKPPRGWVYRSAAGVMQNGATGGQIVTAVQADIRGARKIENGEVYLIVDSDATAGTAFTVNVRGLVRMLVKLA